MLVGLEFKPVEDIPTIMFTKAGVDGYDNMETLRKNLIREMISRFGEDFEFTVKVWVCDGE